MERRIDMAVGRRNALNDRLMTLGFGPFITANLMLYLVIALAGHRY